MKKHFKILLVCFFILATYLLGARLVASASFYKPTGAVDISKTLDKPALTDSDYELLYAQTGLAKPLVQRLEKTSDFKSQMLHFQERYFRQVRVVGNNMNLITNMDQVLNTEDQWVEAFDMAPYDNGYIFLSKSTYTANWRHGHAALVVDAKRGKVLESLEPGTKSILQNASRWEYYPTFKMMRLKDTPQEKLDEIAAYALGELQDIPYNILAMKNFDTAPTSTHCSLIVWQAFIKFGYDLDSSRGIFVSPEDLAASPYLETLQIFGFDPRKAW